MDDCAAPTTPRVRSEPQPPSPSGEHHPSWGGPERARRELVVWPPTAMSRPELESWPSDRRARQPTESLRHRDAFWKRSWFDPLARSSGSILWFAPPIFWVKSRLIVDHWQGPFYCILAVPLSS